MSYCRWSSDNFMCDVYVYEDCYGGWTTHVAGRRKIIPPIPDISFNLLPNFGSKWNQETRKVEYPDKVKEVAARLVFGAWSLWHRWVHGMSMKFIPYRNIGLPCDGARFNHETPGECAENLHELRRMGYNVPQYAIDALMVEADEANQ